MPTSPVGSGHSAVDQLTAQAAAVLASVSARLSAVSDLEQGFDRAHASPATQANHDVQRLQTVFGAGFVALARFTPGNAVDLALALAAATRRWDQMASVTWAQRQALMRPAPARLETVLTFAEAVSGGDGLGFRVAQVPFVSGARWSGPASARPRAP